MPRSLPFAAVLGLALPAAAAPPGPPGETGPCAARAEVVARLSSAYGEQRRGYGLEEEQAGGVVELWASEETGSWTLILTTPEGLACLLASGRHWTPEDVAKLAGDPA